MNDTNRIDELLEETGSAWRSDSAPGAGFHENVLRRAAEGDDGSAEVVELRRHGDLWALPVAAAVFRKSRLIIRAITSPSTAG